MQFANAPPWLTSLPLSPCSIISYNKLQCLQRHALSGLNNLRVLSLHGNRISMLPEGSFEDLKSLTHM